LDFLINHSQHFILFCLFIRFIIHTLFLDVSFIYYETFYCSKLYLRISFYVITQRFSHSIIHHLINGFRDLLIFSSYLYSMMKNMDK